MIKIDSNKCTQCELCVKSCTTSAINPLNYDVNQDRCMGCSHCVAVCPSDAVTQSDVLGKHIDNHNVTPENFENLIYSRKSIRNFTEQEIDDKTLQDFLNLMEYAPTGTNSQETYVTVIRGKDRIQEFSKAMITFFQKAMKAMLNPVTKPIMLLTMGKEKTNKLFGYRNHIVNVEEGNDILAYNSPLIVIFHASPNASTPEMDCNIQSSYASLHAVTLGLGTCFNGFITRGLNGNKKLKKELNIPKKHKVHSSILVGYPELNYKKRVIRQDLKVNVVA